MTTEREERLRKLRDNLARPRDGTPAAPISLPPTDPDLALMVHEYVLRRRVAWNVVILNGWYGSCWAGDTYPRIVIPCTPISRGWFWQARRLQDETSIPRWQSPHGDREDALCRVYTPFTEETNHRPVVVVEGPFDAAVAASLGYDAVAMLGATPNKESILHLREILTRYEWALFLADANSLDKWERLMRQCTSSRPTLLHSSAPWTDLADAPDEGRERLMAVCR